MGRAARDKITGLTDKEEMFCQAIVKDPEMSDSDAYRSAYNCSRMKPETVNGKAYTLKNKEHIRGRIKNLKEERNARLKVSADYVLKRAIEMDQLDVLEIMDDEGKAFKPLKDWPKSWRRSLSAMDVQTIQLADDIESVVNKVKWPDKLQVLKLIGQHVDVGAFKEQVDVTVVDHGSILERAHKRLKKRNERPNG